MQTEAIEVKIESIPQIPDNFLHLQELSLVKDFNKETGELLRLKYVSKVRYVNPNKVISIRQVKCVMGGPDLLEYTIEGNQTFYVEGRI